MPNGASSDVTVSRTIDSSVSQVSWLAVRIVPASVPVCGIAAPPDLRELSSSDEAAFWRDHLTPRPWPRRCTGRVVLLVVDGSSSLWPVTIAAAVLRRAGADAVLPLLIHRRP